MRLADTPHTIVGVMPEGFAFPIFHSAWVPLRLGELPATPGAGPSLIVFGRIAEGYSLSQARAELEAIGERLAAAFPQSHAPLRPRVSNYTQAFLGIDTPAMQIGIAAVQFGAALLLLIVAVNVAVLVYARTATRFGEITVRTALGATRGRVIMQLFVEALVLSLTAAALGLSLLVVALRMFRDYLKDWPDRPDSFPYWIQPGVSADVFVYVGVLAVLAAVLVGVLPALKATGKRVHAGLQQFSSRGAGMQLGRTWTALIIVQVAFTVAVLPGAIYKADRAPPGYDHAAGRSRGETPHEARFTCRREGGWASAEQVASRMTTLMQRLQDEPEVAAVTFADQIPGSRGPRGRLQSETRDSAIISSPA